MSKSPKSMKIFQWISCKLTVAAVVGRVVWASVGFYVPKIGCTWVYISFFCRGLLWSSAGSALRCLECHLNHITNLLSTLLLTTWQQESESCVRLWPIFLAYQPKRETRIRVSDLTGFHTMIPWMSQFEFISYSMNKPPHVFLCSKAGLGN